MKVSTRPIDIKNRKVSFIKHAFLGTTLAGMIVDDDCWWAFNGHRIVRICSTNMTRDRSGPIVRAGHLIAAMATDCLEREGGGFYIANGDVVRDAAADERGLLAKTRGFLSAARGDLDAGVARRLSHTPMSYSDPYEFGKEYHLFMDEEQFFYATDSRSVGLLSSAPWYACLLPVEVTGAMWVLVTSTTGKGNGLMGLSTETRYTVGLMEDVWGKILKNRDAKEELKSREARNA